MKNAFLLLLGLLLLTGCAPDYKAALDPARDAKLVKETTDNKYLGNYKNFDKDKDKNIFRTWVYENYIVFEPIRNNGVSGFEVYKNEKTLEYAKYGKLLIARGEQNFFLGFHGPCLFIDSGTAPGIRGLEIYDLGKGQTIYKDIWNGKSIEFLDDQTIVVAKNPTPAGPVDPRTMTRPYTLNRFALNLKTGQLTDLKKTETIDSY